MPNATSGERHGLGRFRGGRPEVACLEEPLPFLVEREYRLPRPIAPTRVVQVAQLTGPRGAKTCTVGCYGSPSDGPSMRNAILKQAFGAGVCAVIAAASATGAPESAMTPLAADCASLKGFAIPASAIGLPSGGATVETAVAVTASEPRNVSGDFCKVTGIIRNATASTAVFEFEVNLPDTWNGRALQMGGGGYDGSLVN